jgi:saccharopine dehydrogenase-like NADP-dependent oxidoreductase
MRVGALPLYPQNTMLYNLTWSTEGLINEYSNACEAVVNGKVVDTIPLEELENFSMQGVNYECFNTSGGLGTLCETLDGKVKNMNYKTVRFPGHQHLMKFFLKDLRMGEKGKNRQMAMDIFDNAVPVTPQDYVLAFATVKGYINEKLVVKSEVYNIPHQRWVEEDWTSIQITTSAGACVMMDLFKKGYFKKGFAKQEDVKLHNFLNSPFGHCYSRGRITK